MAQKMKVKIRVGEHAGKIFEGEYKWINPTTHGVTIPELNDEFFWNGTGFKGQSKNGNYSDAEYENLWVPYYKDDNGGGEICVGDKVIFVSGKMIKYGVVDKIIPKGYAGGVCTISKVTIRELETNCKYTYQSLLGITKIENAIRIFEKFKAATNP